MSTQPRLACFPLLAPHRPRRGAAVAAWACLALAATAGATTPDGALLFAGTNSYVTLGPAPDLGVHAFTVEAWIRRTGWGRSAFTGADGVLATPLVTKGRAGETGRGDVNFFLGIREGDNRLTADFEEFATGDNFPVAGQTALPPDSQWHHVAATYDGSNWTLYVDGVVDAVLSVGAHRPRDDSLTHAAFATALSSAGSPDGHFEGVMDDVRLWDHARTPAEIVRDQHLEIATAPGLLGRWSLNEGTGNTASNSVNPASDGQLRNGPTWTEGSPKNVNRAPVIEDVLGVSEGSVHAETPAQIGVRVQDADGDVLTVRVYGRPDTAAGAGENFTLVALPDTQHYVGWLYGGRPYMFVVQTEWILNNRAARNIAFVTQLGDCVENGDLFIGEWESATNALYRLESRARTGLWDGIPYDVAVGNHEQFGGGLTFYYNWFFGVNHFNGRGYYGGHYGLLNNNHYSLFRAGGLDYLLLSLEFGAGSRPEVMAWANGVLRDNPDRRAIVVSHSILNADAYPSTYTPEGWPIYSGLRDNPNLFLVLCGHMHGEGRRQEIRDGRLVDLVLSDYQASTNGGNGFLRYLEFSPSNGTMRVRTYSPLINTYMTDEDSEFTLPCDLRPWTLWGTVINPSNGVALITPPPLSSTHAYEWRVDVSDGLRSVRGARNTFVIAGPDDTDIDGMPDAWESLHFGSGGAQPAGDADHDGMSNWREFQAGTDPTNRLSRFAIEVFNTGTAGGTGQTIRVGTVPQRAYTLMAADVALPASAPLWQPVSNAESGVFIWTETNAGPAQHEFQDTSPAVRRFYSVISEPAPAP